MLTRRLELIYIHYEPELYELTCFLVGRWRYRPIVSAEGWQRGVLTHLDTNECKWRSCVLICRSTLRCEWVEEGLSLLLFPRVVAYSCIPHDNFDYEKRCSPRSVPSNPAFRSHLLSQIDRAVPRSVPSMPDAQKRERDFHIRTVQRHEQAPSL